MPEFYTVDRSGKLKPGDILDLVVHQDLNPIELQAHVNSLFPDGVTQHGDCYFLRNQSHASVASPAIELLFEYVRRAHFPDAPSRFQSAFGVESLKEASAFRKQYGGGQGQILRVTAQDSHRVNMALLTQQATTLVQSWYAHQYWGGRAGPLDPFWEHILVPPVYVVDVIDEPL